MRAGVVVTAHPGVEDLAVRAEELGLHSFWLNDTPMVHGDPFISSSSWPRSDRTPPPWPAAAAPASSPSACWTPPHLTGPADRTHPPPVDTHRHGIPAGETKTER